jgi:aspartyl-tRNA(Asn)/glutamyl-tRNA(Gln) amidotransferase subunit C
MKDSQKIDIEALAALSRIEVSEAEKREFEDQIPAILSFVASIQDVSASAVVTPQAPRHRNVMRDDNVVHEPGIYTEDLLKAAPRREKDFVKVSQVLKGGKHT